MPSWKFSRSHDITYIDCPRRAYLTYYYGGTGIVRKGLSLEAETGTLTHAILAGAMRYAMEHGVAPTVMMMNGICDSAITDYRKTVEERGLAEVDGSLELEIQRQTALAEGLARAWVKIRLPYILENYRIIAVEVEREIELGNGMKIMTRIDAVSERKSDGALFAGPEFKTTGWISADYLESWRYDTQILSHLFDVEQTFGRKPEGVLMEFLYKGQKRKGDDGAYTYYSPFLRGFRMNDIMTGQEVYGFDTALGRKKGWTPFEPYTMGLGNWIELVPEDVLKEQLFAAEIFRSDRELEIWRRQIMARQREVREAVRLLREEPAEAAATAIMDSVFPARLDKFCYSDTYRRKCPYLPICYGTLDMPLESGEFVPREPHHPGEFEA